jgi:sublancin family glycopeptide
MELKELVKELSFEELENFVGGAGAVTRAIEGPPTGGGGGGGGIGAAQCLAFWAACTNVFKGCGQGAHACDLYEEYCE